MTLYTIGVYEFDAETFLRALTRKRVTALVDVRARRGVRGHTYAFANAKALETNVTEHGIAYVHEAKLAPTDAIRHAQEKADEAAGTTIRHRTATTPAFKKAYREHILGHYTKADLDALLEEAGARPCLMCVETLASACHRSLAAAWIA
ncbi:MAG: DUF488 domain-containing protein, partial [Candidatus Eremiobacteraeota bacterium]|nr:DUF488 domain-containing protein [Candidatus Eremiobacteraeota bacterium]